ncbi:MAG TPA: ABATE domain-containing protein [Gemmatimonadaceae bacterium]|nr:ABATE domain-containing protein [Gemmatimonadaceae bacterium]
MNLHRANPFVFVGQRLWLDFVNTLAGSRDAPDDMLHDAGALVRWLQAAGVLDAERSAGMLRRAQQQPAGATAALADARRIRAVLRQLAEHGARDAGIRRDVVAEINRVLGRSAGTRRLEEHGDGSFTRAFVPGGDAFAGLMIPIVESAADALVQQELHRVRHCAARNCQRVFQDTTKNAARRWCDMTTCGNRAKADRYRRRIAGVKGIKVGSRIKGVL